MSHADERKERDCLNCGAVVQGRFCHICGQENIITHETFGHMIKHFFYDITHFDSKFLDSLKFLVTKPGFLSRQYMFGKRTTYLNPVKMYVFTSAVFFLLFFSVYGTKWLKVQEGEKEIPSKMEISKVEHFGYMRSATNKDSMNITEAFALIRKNLPNKSNSPDPPEQGVFQMNFEDSSANFSSVKEYDSVQRLLPKEKRDSWLRRIVTRKNIDIMSRYEGDDPRLLKDISNKFMHSFPYILFVSLPLFALFLKLLYIRNKNYFFVDHGIFLIHLYIFTFILMLVFMGLEELEKIFNWGILNWIQGAVVIYGIYYAYKGMKNYYGQRRGKTLLKFILFNILCIISISILFALFLIITILRA